MAIKDEQTLLSRVTWWVFGILALTSVHHAYGAYIFNTPWRLHVVGFAAAAAAVVGTIRWVLRSRTTGATAAIAFVMFTVAALVFPVALIGLFEGGYNHAVKNVLYLGGTSDATMRRLFPPPRYELPSDVLFEVTGVLQLVLAVVALYYLFVLVRSWGSRSLTRDRVHAAA